MDLEQKEVNVIGLKTGISYDTDNKQNTQQNDNCVIIFIYGL
jgi:hypothetical protein